MRLRIPSLALIHHFALAIYADVIAVNDHHRESVKEKSAGVRKGNISTEHRALIKFVIDA